MKNTGLFSMVIAAMVAASASGLTIFETFDENVIANGSWTYTQTIGSDGKDAGNVSYVGVTGTTGGYVTYNVARDTDATTRLYKSLGTTLTNLGNTSVWLEYDFQVLPNNGSAAYSLVGLFKGAAGNDSTDFDTISLRPRQNLGALDASVSNNGVGTNITNTSGTIGTAWVGGTNYRAKIKFTGHKDGPGGTSGTMRLYMDADIYTLDGNTETLLTDGAEIKIFSGASGFSLDSIGFGNNSGGRAGSGNFAIDNFYFSTESANANTVAPFVVPEPATIVILSLGALLFRKK